MEVKETEKKEEEAFCEQCWRTITSVEVKKRNPI